RDVIDERRKFFAHLTDDREHVIHQWRDFFVVVLYHRRESSPHLLGGLGEFHRAPITASRRRDNERRHVTRQRKTFHMPPFFQILADGKHRGGFHRFRRRKNRRAIARPTPDPDHRTRIFECGGGFSRRRVSCLNCCF